MAFFGFAALSSEFAFGLRFVTRERGNRPTLGNDPKRIFWFEMGPDRQELSFDERSFEWAEYAPIFHNPCLAVKTKTRDLVQILPQQC